VSNNGREHLIEALKYFQGDKSMAKFAKELCIAYSTLYQIYTGQRNPGRLTLARMIQALPELKPAVEFFLASDFAIARKS
jgi:DNA-binding phage protein